MIENIAKKKIREGQPVLLAGLTIADPNIAEMFALCGADIVMIDNEHMTFDDTRLVDCCRAVTMHGKTCLLRTSVKDPEILGRYMQFGFQGIVATVCHGLEDAKRVISAVKYPPVGKKGLSNECRASEFGIRGGMNTAEYMQWSNDNSIVIITVESLDGVQDAEAICRLPDVDMVHIGPVDLSASMGLGGETRLPEIRDILSETNRSLAALGNYNAYFAECAEDVPRLLDKGAKCIFLPTDIHILRDFLVPFGKIMAEEQSKHA